MGNARVACFGLMHPGRGDLRNLHLGMSAQVSLLSQFCFPGSMVLFPGILGTLTLAETHFFLCLKTIYLLDLNDPQICY